MFAAVSLPRRLRAVGFGGLFDFCASAAHPLKLVGLVIHVEGSPFGARRRPIYHVAARELKNPHGRAGWADPKLMWSPAGHRVEPVRKWGTWKIDTLVSDR